jgi:hypothetical protein
MVALKVAEVVLILVAGLLATVGTPHEAVVAPASFEYGESTPSLVARTR